MINNEQAKIDAVLDVSKVSYLQSTMFPVTIQTYARDLLEARERIKEVSQTLLAISQYPIAFVCEDVRTLARNEWEKTKEYVRPTKPR